MKPKFRERLLGKLKLLDTERVQGYFSQLASESGFLDTVFNSLHDGVIVINADGRIAYLNRAATELLGVPQDAALGLSLGRYLPDLNWSSNSGSRPRAFSREMAVSYPRPRYLHLHAVPLAAGADGRGAVLILRDVTESRRETAEAISAERNEALTLLAASVAHEIGNPLNSLHIHLQLLERELRGLPEEKRAPLRESLQVAKTEVARLDGIVSRFLRAARPLPVRLELEPINPVVEETLRFMGAEIEAASVTAEASLAHGLPRLWLDHDQMKQVLINLIKNALQAMTAGGKLTVGTERIEDSVVISVCDTGQGIASDEIGRIFEPYQGRRAGGMGLGLMIVRRIVQQHGGAIEVDSLVGRGTVFRIRLPTPEKRMRLLEAPATAAARQLAIAEAS